MANIQVKIARDQLTAFITIENDLEPFPSEAEIENALHAAGVVFGIDRQAIREIVSAKKNVYDRAVAFGRHRHQVEKNQLVWYIDLDVQQRPKIRIDGSADFKELKTVEIIRRNQEIVSLVPLPDNFTNKKVTGEEFSVTESYLQHICGKNIRLTEDGLTLVANIDGCVFWKDGKLQVDNIYHINGNVDFRTGNIHFDGTIVIEGDVRPGFRVTASGSVYINGTVEAAEIVAERGDIHVKSGVLGKGKTRLIAGGNLHCYYIQDAVVGVKKDVIIERYAINTSISAGGSIYLIQNEGLIRGGKVFADQGMRAMEVGSPQNIPTSIGLSGKEFCELDAKCNELLRVEEDLQSQRAKILKKIEFLHLLAERLGGLSQEKVKDLQTIQETLKTIEDSLANLAAQKAELVEKYEQVDQQNNIEVYRLLHKGVYITIGDKEYINEETASNVRIFRRGNEIFIEKCGV